MAVVAQDVLFAEPEPAVSGVDAVASGEDGQTHPMAVAGANAVAQERANRVAAVALALGVGLANEDHELGRSGPRAEVEDLDPADRPVVRVDAGELAGVVEGGEPSVGIDAEHAFPRDRVEQAPAAHDAPNVEPAPIIRESVGVERSQTNAVTAGRRSARTTVPNRVSTPVLRVLNVLDGPRGAAILRSGALTARL